MDEESNTKEFGTGAVRVQHSKNKLWETIRSQSRKLFSKTKVKSGTITINGTHVQSSKDGRGANMDNSHLDLCIHRLEELRPFAASGK